MLLMFFIYTFFVPNNPLNPFPPSLEVVIAETSTAESTSTPTKTPVPPTETPKPIPEITPTLETGILFEVQKGTPFYLQHPSGCEYLYIGGGVLDINGDHFPGIIVRISGNLKDQVEIKVEAISGTALQHYSGGYEIQIGELESINDQTDMFIQLFLEDGSSASPVFSFNTSGICGNNLIYVNFLQVRN